ncbi:MAG TPA: hypothetical protein VMJ64_01625 [Anaerolineales bacterium]|nr:hypothetical protein [Anaerolineales bacterium]
MRNDTGRWAVLFLISAVLFGAMVRFAPTLLAHSAINDGGMFYAMIEDLKANGLRLPAYTSYNHLNIPFAYPPLSLYAGAILAAIGIPTGEVIRWLPALVSTLSILAFFWMASQMTGSRSVASMATVAYALMPRTFSWYVMGGGLSRSLGILFLLLTCGSAWTLFGKPSWGRIALTALFGAGAVLSHPETGLHALGSCALIWLFRGRNARGLRDAALVALGVLLFTSPWWGTVLAQDGLAPIRSALSTGGHSGLFWTPWITMDFAEERFATVITVLGLIGFVVKCIRRDWFLPVWLLVPFVIEPRSATAIAALPLAILAGYGLADFVIPKIASLASGTPAEGADWTSYMEDSRAVKLMLAYVLFSMFVGAFAYDLSLARYVIPDASKEAMQWVHGNTPEGSRFVVLTGRPDAFSDPSTEWFPVLADRTSVNTVQGQEWTLGSKFMPVLYDLPKLQACLNAGPACVEKWATDHKAGFDYLYLEKPADETAAEPSGLLLYQLRQDSQYSLVFENSGVAVFERKQ